MRKVTVLIAMSLILGASTPLWAVNYDVSPSPDPGYEVTKWLGDKYAGGNLSVLVFKTTWCYTPQTREVYDFQRAFGFDVDLVIAQGVQYFGGTDNARARKLLDSRKYDVICFWSGTKGNFNPGYPACDTDVQFRILSQVNNGTGLVITDSVPKEIFTPERQVTTPVPTLLGGLG